MSCSPSAVYDAVKAVADAILDKPCATRLASSLLAAAVRAATASSTRTGSHDGLVDELVDDRLNLIRPVLHAQTLAGLETGENPHTAKGLVDDEKILRANSARHAGFNKDKLISKTTDKELKHLQRSGRQPKCDDEVLALVGRWSSIGNPSIRVVRTAMGVYTEFDDDPTKLFKICSTDGRIELNGCSMVERTKDTVRWLQRATDFRSEKEIVWEKAPVGSQGPATPAGRGPG